MPSLPVFDVKSTVEAGAMVISGFDRVRRLEVRRWVSEMNPAFGTRSLRRASDMSHAVYFLRVFIGEREVDMVRSLRIWWF